MSAKAQSEIQKAQQHWEQAKRTSPPCPVFTAAAIASYDEAIRTIEQRRAQLQGILDEQRRPDKL